MVAAFIATAFAQDHADAARAQWRQVADQVRTKLPKLAALLVVWIRQMIPRWLIAETTRIKGLVVRKTPREGILRLVRTTS